VKDPRIEWEQQPDRDSWLAHLGIHCIGHVFKYHPDVDARQEKPGLWQYRINDLRPIGAKGHGATRSLPDSKQAVKKAVRQWFIEADLVDERKPS
jgi:hypothetical protein